MLAFAIVVVPAAAAHKPSANKGHSRPNCRALLSLSAIEGATGKSLEYYEWAPEPFLLGSGDEIARGQACDYSDPARAEFTVDPYAGYFKAAFEGTPRQWNKLRSIEKNDPLYGDGNTNFKTMKTVDGAKLFSIGPTVPVVTPNLSETGETSFIFGYTRQHNVFQVGITNVPIATELSLVAGIAEALDAEWLHRGRNG
ncbi:MAG: hypothetical protein ACRDPE_10985 [Solirubrobacterales bacterium]